MSEDPSQFYESMYEQMFYRGGAAGKATRKIHRLLESSVNRDSFPRTLEIGGGEGLHVEHVTHHYDCYFLTDIELRPLTVTAQKTQAEGRLVHREENAESLSFDDAVFDRVIFMCVLHHLSNPEKALVEAKRVTRPGGVVSIYLPCDPGLIYRLLRRVVVGRRAASLGLDYQLVNSREHRNHFFGLWKMISHTYMSDEIRVKRFPFPVFGGDLNVAYFVHITVNPVKPA